MSSDKYWKIVIVCGKFANIRHEYRYSCEKKFSKSILIRLAKKVFKKEVKREFIEGEDKLVLSATKIIDGEASDRAYQMNSIASKWTLRMIDYPNFVHMTAKGKYYCCDCEKILSKKYIEKYTGVDGRKFNLNICCGKCARKSVHHNWESTYGSI